MLNLQFNEEKKCPRNKFRWQRLSFKAPTSFANPLFYDFSELFGNIGRNKGETIRSFKFVGSSIPQQIADTVSGPVQEMIQKKELQ